MNLGIAVSKSTLDVALLIDKGERKPRHKVFANTHEGHQQLLHWLESNCVTTLHVCLEATGT